MKIFKSWILSILIAAGMFFLVRPVLAQTVGVLPVTQVGSETVDGYSQVYYSDSGGKHFITSGILNSKNPHSAGTYIAYETEIYGAGQIFLYDRQSGAKTQLTFSGTNLNPVIDEKGRIAWEGWVDGKWQIFFFDGKTIKKLTDGDTSLNPDISGEYLSYGRRDITGTWRAVVYSIAEDRSADVTLGENAKKPKLKDGNIFLTGGSDEEKFPLSAADLFLLNLSSLSKAPLASQSASPAPQSTLSGQINSTPTPPTSTP